MLLVLRLIIYVLIYILSLDFTCMKLPRTMHVRVLGNMNIKNPHKVRDSCGANLNSKELFGVRGIRYNNPETKCRIILFGV